MRLRSSDGWKAKSKPDSVLIVAEAGHLQRRLDAAALADGELLGEQHLDRLDGADLAAFDLLDEIAERFERARHAECDQVAADALDRCVRLGLASHGCGPAAARRRATAS